MSRLLTPKKMKRQRLSRTLWTGMTRVPPVDPVEHISQLRSRDPDHAIGRRRPNEATLLQPFGVRRHAATVMPDYFDQIAARASEDKEIARMGITPQCFLDLQSQAVHAAPHVGSPDRKPDPSTRGNWDHRRSNTSSTRRSARPSKPLPTRTRYLSARSISIVSATLNGCVATASRSPVTITGIS